MAKSKKLIPPPVLGPTPEEVVHEVASKLGVVYDFFPALDGMGVTEQLPVPKYRGDLDAVEMEVFAADAVFVMFKALREDHYSLAVPRDSWLAWGTPLRVVVSVQKAPRPRKKVKPRAKS